MTEQPLLGRFCAWCGEPAIGSIEVEPAQYRTVTKRSAITGEITRASEIARFEIRADVCASHWEICDRVPGQPVSDPRRRKAKGVVQLDLFGGETSHKRKPDNAIRGTQ